jgi:hypothetical protein
MQTSTSQKIHEWKEHLAFAQGELSFDRTKLAELKKYPDINREDILRIEQETEMIQKGIDQIQVTIKTLQGNVQSELCQAES